MCDSKELLVGFLYDEIDPVIEANVRTSSRDVRGLPRGTGGARRHARADSAVVAAGCRSRVSHSARRGRPDRRASVSLVLAGVGPGGSGHHRARHRRRGCQSRRAVRKRRSGVRTGWNHAPKSQARRDAGGLEGAGAGARSASPRSDEQSASSQSSPCRMRRRPPT